MEYRKYLKNKLREGAVVYYETRKKFSSKQKIGVFYWENGRVKVRRAEKHPEKGVVGVKEGAAGRHFRNAIKSYDIDMTHPNNAPIDVPA